MPPKMQCSGRSIFAFERPMRVSDGALSRDAGTLSVPTLVFRGHERAHLLPLPLAQQELAVAPWPTGAAVLRWRQHRGAG